MTIKTLAKNTLFLYREQKNMRDMQIEDKLLIFYTERQLLSIYCDHADYCKIIGLFEIF